MKTNVLRTAALLSSLAATAALAQPAQTTGNATVHGRVDPSFALSAAPTDGGSVDQLLAFTHTFPYQAPDHLGEVQVANFGFRLRANAPYQVTAAYVKNTDADGGSDVLPSDIGFAITAVTAPTSTKIVGTHNLTNDAEAPWAIPTPGLQTSGHKDSESAFGTPAAGPNLDNMGTGTGSQIMIGDRISNRGNYRDPDNAIDVTGQFGFLPQYFSVGTFSYTVNLTILPNP